MSIDPRHRSPGPGPARAEHAWDAAELASRRGEWELGLAPEEIRELERAVGRCLDAGRDLLEVDREAFALPRLTRRLAAIRRQVLHGLGVAFVRGLPVARWTRRECAMAFWGIGTHLGDAVSQNAQGHVLGHVKDLGLDYGDHDTRGYQTRARLAYHTDYSDIVALLCLHPAHEGGLSSIASSSRIHAEMLRRRPDLVRVLTRPVCRTRWGEVSAGQKPWIEVPVFNEFPRGVSTTYVRSAIRKAQELEQVPRLSEAQVEALDLFDALAADPEFHVDMAFAPGDVQILCNHVVVHSRTGYVDHGAPQARRHLLRLWLACEDGPPFPLAMTEQFQGLTRNGRPNGIHVAGVPFVAPLDAP
jgi:hypothetical protein